MKAIKFLTWLILTVIIIDVLILFAVIAQILAGEPTPHIPFWDKQIEVVVKLLMLLHL